MNVNENPNYAGTTETAPTFNDLEAEINAPITTAEENAISSIINGDVCASFNILAGGENFTAREAYQVTRPDDGDENTISIGKECRNKEIEFDRYLVYSFENKGSTRVGITILGRDGKKYVTTSPYFIKEFILLTVLYHRDGVELDKIKVTYRESANKTADGNKMTYPLPIGL